MSPGLLTLGKNNGHGSNMVNQHRPAKNTSAFLVQNVKPSFWEESTWINTLEPFPNGHLWFKVCTICAIWQVPAAGMASPTPLFNGLASEHTQAESTISFWPVVLLVSYGFLVLHHLMLSCIYMYLYLQGAGPYFPTIPHANPFRRGQSAGKTRDARDIPSLMRYMRPWD